MNPIPPVSNGAMQAPGSLPGRTITRGSGPQIGPGGSERVSRIQLPRASVGAGPVRSSQAVSSSIGAAGYSNASGRDSTISRLARQFDASKLVTAAIKAHNPQDFSGPALPSGKSIDSQTLSASSTMYSQAGAPEESRAEELAHVPAEYLQAQFEADEALLDRLPGAGLRVVENGGADENLCLIISMLHHLHEWAGAEQHLVDARAREVRGELMGRADALGAALQQGQGLYSDRALVSALAGHIFGPGNVPPMLFMIAGAQGRALLFDPLRDHANAQIDPATVPHGTAVILERPGHFEAVANTSGLPWYRVLAQLHEAPQAEEEAHEDVQPLQTMGITSMTSDRRTQQHQWQRGAQTRLAPQDMLGLAPLERGRAMAVAQGVVNEVLAALERWTVFDLGQTLAADAQVHRLGLSPLDDYHEHLSKNARGRISLDGLNEGETGHQYLVEARVREGWLIALAVQSSGEGDIVVHYDNPWPETSLRTMGINAKTDDGHTRKHEWRRGAQTQLEPQDLDQDAAPWVQARAMTEAQGVVDEVLAALERWTVFDLGQTPADDDAQVHELGLSPVERRTGHRYRVQAQVRQSRLIALTVHSPGTGDIVVHYENPWSPPLGAGHLRTRKSLTHPDDLDAFDEFAARERTANLSSDPKYFAAFLHDLRKHGAGMAWEEFRNSPEKVREEYLHMAVAEGHLHPSAPAVVRRAIDPQRTARPRHVRESLTDPADLKAFDEFERRARAAGRRRDPPCFAAFLLDLRKHGGGMTWEEFRNRPEKVREEYMQIAVAEGRLHTSMPAAVRRAIDPQRTTQRKIPARDSLTHPDDLEAFDAFAEKAHAAGRVTDPSHFASFLRYLRERGQGLTWEKFLTLSKDERQRYLSRAVADHHLSPSAPSAVKRAILALKDKEPTPGHQHS